MAVRQPEKRIMLNKVTNLTASDLFFNIDVIIRLSNTVRLFIYSRSYLVLKQLVILFWIEFFSKRGLILQTVVVLGASPKPGRFAYKALVKLKNLGYTVLPVHPKAEMIEEIRVYASLEQIDQPVDTVTLYVGPARMVSQVDAVCALKPARVIFNQGTESDEIQQRFEQAGIDCVIDCTLIMLDENRF